MSVFIWTTNREQPDFEFDITETHSHSQRFQVSKRPVENTGFVADHVYAEPYTLSSNGFVAVTPITSKIYRPIPSTSPLVMNQAKETLLTIANRGDFVNLVSENFVGKVVISALEFSKSTGDGYAMRVNITFTEIRVAIPQTTQIQASRLRPKVKKRSPTKGGTPGAPQGASTPAQKAKASTAYKLKNSFWSRHRAQ